LKEELKFRMEICFFCAFYFQKVAFILSIAGPQHFYVNFKGRVHSFLMQVVMNKCFLLNAEK